MNNFSYRAQGLLMRAGHILLQTDMRDTELVYALPGGGVEFGEGAAEALVREFFEETGVEFLEISQSTLFQWYKISPTTCIQKGTVFV